MNPTIVITGASAGVGRAAAHRFGRAGAKLGLIGRDLDALREVEGEVNRLGGMAVPVIADVADPVAVFRAADVVRDAFGEIDVWINNAMVTVFGPVSEITAEEFRRVTEVSYLGFVHGTMAALRSMRSNNRGHIIQIGSALAYRGIPLQAAYCGAKHAVRGFTESLRSELIHAGSRINLSILELPAVNTPQFDWARTHMHHRPRPVPPIVQPEVVADAIVEMVANPTREYWIGWSSAKTILGNMLLPGFLDRYLADAAVRGQQTRLPVSSGRTDNLMEPVRQMHRTRGSFGSEARDSAFVVRGRTGRLAPLAAGALVSLAVGLLIARGLRARTAQYDMP